MRKPSICPPIFPTGESEAEAKGSGPKGGMLKASYSILNLFPTRRRALGPSFRNRKVNRNPASLAVGQLFFENDPSYHRGSIALFRICNIGPQPWKIAWRSHYSIEILHNCSRIIIVNTALAFSVGLYGIRIRTVMN